MPECPLLDGSLAYTEKLKITIVNNCGKNILEIYFNNNAVSEFNGFLRFIRDTESVQMRAAPESSHFSHIFDLKLWLT